MQTRLSPAHPESGKLRNDNWFDSRNMLGISGSDFQQGSVAPTTAVMSSAAA